ncbi:MAG: NADH-quinone oxidoreductase subunit J [Rhodospirillaceae bacterium]|nr:NADH-quinone oxidoreductase subunit J [Rhodospirillaceae bacterium]
MVIQGLAFYLFALITVAAGVMVITARNPVHSVLYLILAFFNSAALFLLMGAEFVAFILIIVYVGAVAVLFLFVVMMLDIDFARLREGVVRYLPIGALVGLVLLVELLVVLGAWTIAPGGETRIASPQPSLESGLTNTEALGNLIYTDYVYAFQIAGLILLVAMIGAIVLTLRTRTVRRQRIADQVNRRPEEVLVIRKVEPGEGI